MARRLARAVGSVLLVLVLTAVMAVVHLPTRAGRTAVRDVANAILRGLFQGELHIGEVTHLDPFGRLVATGLTLTDPDGHRIAEGGTLVASPLTALWRGLRRVPGGSMPTAELHLRRLVLRPSREPGAETVPSIADAFALRHPTPPPAHPTTPERGFEFDRLLVSVDRIESTLVGIPATGHDVRARGSLLTEPINIDSRTVAPAAIETERVAPFTAAVAFSWHSRLVSGGPGQPPREVGPLRVAIDLNGEAMRCHFAYESANDRSTITAEGCRAGAAVIDRLSGQPLGLGAELATLQATQSRGGPWTVTARGDVNAAPFEIAATLDTSAQRVDLTVQALDLSRVRPDLPASTIDGTLRLEHHDDEWRLDTTRLRARVLDQSIPPAVARGDLRGRRLRLQELTAPSAGLTARGEVDLASPQLDGWLEAHLDTPEIGALPLAPAGAHGRLQAEVRAERRGGQTTGTFRARGQRLRIQNARIADASADGSLRLMNGVPRLEADVRASGVVSGDLGPLDVSGHVAGNPLEELTGSVHADATRMMPAPRGAVATAGRTRIDGRFRARITPDRVRVQIARSPVLIRGAEGEVEGEVELPRGRGRLVGRARVTTREGGEAEVNLRGTSVTGRFRRFPLEWVGRVLGTEQPLAGTLEGDLATLTDRAGRSRGVLRWTDGRLPHLGEFDLEITADHTDDVSELHAVLTVGANRRQLPPAEQQVVRAQLHVRPPRNLGDVQGWVRGLRDADIEAAHFALGALDGVLPRGTHLKGTSDLRLRALRETPEAPLEWVLGLDVRQLELGADTTQYIPAAVRTLVRNAAGVRPLTVPLRARGAVCGRVLRDDLTRVPITLDTALALEAGDPVQPPPSACTEEATQVRERLVRTSGSLEGPWYTALLDAWNEYDAARARGVSHLREMTLRPETRAALIEARTDVSVEVGPLQSDRWPFTRTMATLVPALATPPIPGVADASVRVAGSLYSPRVSSSGHLHTSGIEALVSRDALDVEFSATLAPSRDGGPILGPVSVEADANARLLARTPRGTEDAGTGSLRLRTHGQLARMLDPSEGLRAAEIEQFQIDTSRFQIGRLRWARANTINGLLTLTLRETGDPITPIAGNATLTDVHVRNQRPSSASLNGFIRNTDGVWEIQSCVTALASPVAPEICDPDAPIDNAPDGGLRGGMTLPLRGDLLRFAPDLTGLRLAVAAQRFRLETISPLVETSPIVRIGGAFTGQAEWTARAPRAASGTVHIEDGLLDIERIGQPARNVTIDLHAQGRRIQINRVHLELTTETSPGTLEARGTADLAGTGDHIATLRLRAHAQRLPAMQEGNVYGLITGDIEYDGVFRTTRHTARARVLSASVVVPVRPTRTLQELEPHPGVFVVGETRIATGARARPYPIDIEFETDNPVSLRRSDFEIFVRANGHLHYDPAGLALRGRVEQAFRQSFFDLFGKRFYFDRIAIEFDGSLEFNPILDVVAHLDAPDTGRINLMVTGRYQNPDIRFAAERFPAASQSEVLALLVLGRRESRGASEQSFVTQEASEQTAALLTGLALGFASNVIEQQFRQGRVQIPWVQRIILEPGTRGAQGVRGGLGLTPLPNVYVEGTYGAVTSYGGVVGAGAGALGQEGKLLVEWSFSRHFSLGVTGAWAGGGTAGNQQRYGVDLFYSP